EGMRRRGTLLFDEDGAEGRVTVRRSPGGILSLQINGRTEASTGADMSTQLLAAHLPLFLHEGGAPRTLLIGLASGVSLGAIESHPVAAIRVIEIVPGVVRAAAWFAESNHAALRDPRVRITLDDARAALLARSERYDLIISQPSNPWVSGVANLFTVEFYRLAKRRLAPGGMLGQWIQAYRLAPSDLAGVVGAFLEVFPDATLWEESPGGGDYFLIGGDHPLRVDPSRWLEPGYAAAWSDLQRIGISAPAQILGRFAAGPEALRAFAGGARPQTDDDLYLEWRAPLALFKDTLRDQLAALDRHRESPLTILAGGEQARPPGLIASLHGMEQARQSRLAMLSGLRDADLWSLRDPFLDSGIEALRGSRFVEAAATLTRAATANPKSGTAQLLLAEAYRAAGLPGAAEVAYRAAIERDPDLPAAWNGLGSCLAGRGRTDEARLAFLRALQIDPALAPARNNLGALLLSTGDDVGAESALRSALAIDPALMAARVNLGLIMKRRGDLRGAVESDRAALALDPLNGDARFNLAVALAASGRPDEARRELLTLLRSDPADPQAARALREIETSGRIRGSEKERARRPAPAPTPP
ncbi:MAG TPA: tetratricopeptide repeat protein, partial [Candidatus Polarisedimenticolia bacterium]